MSLLVLNTKTDVANAAMAHLLHDNEFVDLDTSTGKYAGLALQFYQQSLDEITIFRNWRFATAIVQPTEVAAGGSYQPLPYDHGFSLPTECLRVRSVYAKDAEHVAANLIGYDLRENKLYAAVDEIDIVYTKRLTNLANTVPLFVHAVAYRLAYHLALPVTASIEMKDAMYVASMRAAAEGWVDHVVGHKNEQGGTSSYDPPSSIAARYG